MDTEYLAPNASLVEAAGARALPRLIAERYRIDGLLAEGGMGVVFHGWHVLLEQPIAIKVLKDEYSGNPEAVARFLREARATAGLQGRHVAHVFDIGKINGRTPFMVTELLHGADLGKLLAGGPFSPEQAVTTLLAVCDAVLEVHAAGIVHRDLKPDNLFLVEESESPYVKILDFGVARPLRSNLTSPERGVGSPHYMSPEQILTPQQVDFRSDVWSLGVVLYELLTAEPPFSAATIPELCARIVRSDFTRAANWSSLPPGLAAIICRCLEKDREARYANVSELRKALSAVQLGAPIRNAEPEPVRVRGSGALLLATSVVAGALSFAGVVVVLDRATAATPARGTAVAASVAPRGTVPASSPPPNVGGSPQVSGPTGAVAVEPVPPPQVGLACAPPVTATTTSSRPERIPLRVEREARREAPPAPSWLWLERDAGRPELAHQDIVSPYTSKPWPRR